MMGPTLFDILLTVNYLCFTLCGNKDNRYICIVSGSPSTIKWNCLFVIMEKVRLRVQTVPATDPVTLKEHIAYNVIAQDGDNGCIRLAPGWTLRDAIETFCEWFQVEREQICILRPFIPQSGFFYE